VDKSPTNALTSSVSALSTYEMLTGRRAVSQGRPIETMSAILYQKPGRLPRRVPRAIAKIILRCLAKEPTQRYGTAKDVVLDLALASKGTRQ
jgi:serine/threonine protein kinase